MVLPEGFAFPPLLYSLVLLGGLLIVGLGLLVDDPPVTRWTILAFVPWMGAGGALHVMYVHRIVDEPTRHLLGTPAVYVFVAILGGIAWLLARRTPSVETEPRPVAAILGLVGVVALAVPTLVVLGTGLERGSLAPGWPAVALVATIVVTVAVWLAVARWLPAVATETGAVGVTLLFAHVLDAVTTTVGIDILGAVERTPLPRLIMDTAALLPTADLIGTGWAFVVVKIAISVGLLWIFVPMVRDSRQQAYIILGLLAALGMGPGVHNLLLFTLAG